MRLPAAAPVRAGPMSSPGTPKTGTESPRRRLDLEGEEIHRELVDSQKRGMLFVVENRRGTRKEKGEQIATTSVPADSPLSLGDLCSSPPPDDKGSLVVFSFSSSINWFLSRLQLSSVSEKELYKCSLTNTFLRAAQEL